MAVRTGFALEGGKKEEKVDPPTPEKKRKTQVAAAREGMRQFTFYVPPEAYRQVRTWVGGNDCTIQRIGEEMLNDWFAKHGLNRIACRVAKMTE
jgi:hypothetical protein